MQVAVLFGQLEVEGCELKRKQKPLDLYSSDEQPLIFTLNYDDKFNYDRLRSHIEKLKLPGHLDRLLLHNEQSFEGSFTFVSIRKAANNPFESILNQLTHGNDSYLAPSSTSSSIAFEPMPKSTFTVSDRWVNSIRQLVDDQLKKDSVLMVCGGRNVGKSSLTRWVTNRLLHTKRFDQVYYLDLDSGQPQFGNCAQLTLTKVTRPVLTPPNVNVWRYHEQMLYSCSIGSANVEDLSSVYTSNLAHLWFQKVLPMTRDGPIIVNTMGFVRVIGFMLLIDAIRLIQPTHLIEIRFEIPANTRNVHDINYPIELRPESVVTSDGWLDRLCDLDLKYTYISLLNKFHLVQKKTFQARLNMQLGYMCNNKSLLYRPLSSLVPFRLPLADLSFYINNDCEIAPNLVLDIINCAWVQLCIIDRPPLIHDSIDSILNCFEVLNDLPVNECIGCGLVRNISIVDRRLYVISPEADERLARVNCLVKPGVLITPNELTLAFQEGSSLLNQHVGC